MKRFYWEHEDGELVIGVDPEKYTYMTEEEQVFAWLRTGPHAKTAIQALIDKGIIGMDGFKLCWKSTAMANAKRLRPSKAKP